MGDLNLDFDNPAKDRPKIEKTIKALDGELGKLEEGANVNFPFLDPHPVLRKIFRTNARMTETFDQIALFSRDSRLPRHLDHATMGSKPRGPDYGVFEFCNLFSEALLDRSYDELPNDEKVRFTKRFDSNVSDHMPLWLRLPLPEA